MNSPVDKLKESYDLLTVFVENPKKMGYLLLFKKLKGESKSPINLNLFQLQKDIDVDIEDMVHRIRKKIGWYGELPDGINKRG